MSAVRAQNSAADQEDALDRFDWSALGDQLDREGCALLPGLFAQDAEAILSLAAAPTGLRRTDLATLGWGLGERLDWGEDLPAMLATWRTRLYRRLVPIANRWNEVLGDRARFPAHLPAFEAQNRAYGQAITLSHLTRLGTQGHLALRQDTGGTQVFPLQIVGLLSAPERDFTGGAFILTEQRPRMQSRPMVVPLQYGDAAIVCTGPRPVRSNHGAYRVHIRHAIGRVRTGQRIGLSLSFHNAAQPGSP